MDKGIWIQNTFGDFVCFCENIKKSREKPVNNITKLKIITYTSYRNFILWEESCETNEELMIKISKRDFIFEKILEAIKYEINFISIKSISEQFIYSGK